MAVNMWLSSAVLTLVLVAALVQPGNSQQDLCSEKHASSCYANLASDILKDIKGILNIPRNDEGALKNALNLVAWKYKKSSTCFVDNKKHCEGAQQPAYVERFEAVYRVVQPVLSVEKELQGILKVLQTNYLYWLEYFPQEAGLIQMLQRKEGLLSERNCRTLHKRAAQVLEKCFVYNKREGMQARMKAREMLTSILEAASGCNVSKCAQEVISPCYAEIKYQVSIILHNILDPKEFLQVLYRFFKPVSECFTLLDEKCTSTEQKELLNTYEGSYRIFFKVANDTEALKEIFAMLRCTNDYSFPFYVDAAIDDLHKRSRTLSSTGDACRNFREDLLSTLDWSTAYCNAQVSSGKERSKKALMDFGNIWCSFETRKKGEGEGKGDSASSVYVSMTLVFIFATISLTQTHFLT